mmetsp:Transcript_10920/g.19096  ORF Transcript_10920/g.19096 Transcript_10920/m.19096 type:complete len:299 (+) Transcript_10920:1323-2219(+)
MINSKTQAVLDGYIEKAKSSFVRQRQMQKEWDTEEAKHRRGGARQWPVWVVQLICELLVNGTAPVAVPENIQTMYETLYGVKPKELPDVSFVRRCRKIIEVIGETLAAIRLGDAEKWDQLWTDATTRRQIPFTALIIGMISDDGKIDPVVVSSCIFMDEEQSETQAAGIVEKINSLKQRLHRLKEVMDKHCPNKSSQIPRPDSININKLGQGGNIMTDTCNTARKIRRILVDEIDGAYDYDCMNHLRNVWFGNMEKKLTRELNQEMRESIDAIDPRLLVAFVADMSPTCRPDTIFYPF